MYDVMLTGLMNEAENTSSISFAFFSLIFGPTFSRISTLYYRSTKKANYNTLTYSLDMQNPRFTESISTFPGCHNVSTMEGTMGILKSNTHESYYYY